MDFNRNTGTFRMLDNLLPDVSKNMDNCKMRTDFTNRLEPAPKTAPKRIKRRARKAEIHTPKLQALRLRTLGHRKWPFRESLGLIRYEEPISSPAASRVDW